MTDLQPKQSVTTVDEAYDVCHPEVPLEADDPRYVDLHHTRGGINLAQTVANRIRRTRSPHFHQQLITGHRGDGKSTELKRLAASLQEQKFFAVYLDVEEVLDLADIQHLDILLSIARTVHEALREGKIDLSAQLLKNLDEWFAERVLTEEHRRDVEAAIRAEAGAGAPIPFLRLLAVVTSQIKVGGSRREEVRRRLEPQLREFLDRLNQLLDDAQVQLSRRGWKGLVAIVDGLEKMQYRLLPDGQSNHAVLFVQHAEQLKAPRCHLVYAVPVSLAFNANLASSFVNIEIMPMVKITERDGQTPNKEGRLALSDVVARRVNVGLVFEESEEAVQKLVEISGGNVRDLMRLVRFACDGADQRITMDNIERAIRELAREYDYQVRDEDLDQLMKIARERRVPGDEASGRFLHQRLVLEYYNGERWADLHPAVRLTPRVRQRRQEAGGDAS